MITASLIKAINPQLPEARCAEIASGLQTAAQAAQINTPARVAAFLAQLAHESCGFRYSEEIWGPTAAQRRYEGRKDLGNTVKGDGYRYRGRGFIQLTGRHNYQKYGFALGLPLVEQPDLAARPDVAARVAAAYWTSAGLNALADAGNFREITRRINGGFNGWDDRVKRWEAIKRLLAAQPAPPAQGRVLLAVPGRPDEPQEWDGKPAVYGGIPITPELISQLRTVYPQPGGPWQYQGLRVWVRQNGDLVLDKTPA